MKLEDKIKPHARLWDCYNDETEKYNHINKLIKVAEDFAIGFAEWIFKKDEENKNRVKELLEIYKKERGI